MKMWKCVCGELMTEQQVEDATVCIDYGDRYQPPENASYCVACGKDHEYQDEVIICESEGCEQEPPEGWDYCVGCSADAAELIMEDR